MKDKIKRWARGLLVLIGAWAGGSGTFPLADGPDPEDDADTEEKP